MSQRAPRRTLRRRTGRVIVDALLDAAASLLASDGLAGMTTNAVAERAGVSVGSLYQYFPNKQALVAAVGERVNAALVARVEAIAGGPTRAEDKLDALLTLLCSEEFGERDVRRALARDVPRGWVEAGIEAAERRTLALVAPVVRELAPSLDADEAERRARVALFALRGAVQGLLLHELERLTDPARRARLRASVVALLLDA